MDITVIKGFPVSSVVKNTPASAGDPGDTGWIPGPGRSPGGGKGNTLQYSCRGKSRGQRSLAGVHRVTESDMTEHAYTHTHTPHP